MLVDERPVHSVNGCFSAIQTCDTEFDSIISQLRTLHEPYDISDVTAIFMAEKKEDQVFALYLFLAGHVAEEVHIKENTWMISTVRLKNDDLYEMIEDECEATLNGIEAEDKINYWKDESMLFTVADSVPSYNCDGMESLQALSACSDNNNSPDRTRQQYIFHHPENNSMFICVYEPNSPGKADMHISEGSSGSGKATVSLQQSRSGRESAPDNKNSGAGPFGYSNETEARGHRADNPDSSDIKSEKRSVKRRCEQSADGDKVQNEKIKTVEVEPRHIPEHPSQSLGRTSRSGDCQQYSGSKHAVRQRNRGKKVRNEMLMFV